MPEVSQLEQVLRASSFSALIEGHPDATYVYDLDGVIVECNSALEEVSGYARTELIGATFAPIIHPDDLDEAWAAFHRAASGQSVRYLTRGVTKHGESIRLDVTKLPLRTTGGSVVGVIGIARDIGELSAALAEVDHSHAIMRMAGRIAKVAGWSFDVETRALLWSDEFVDLMGLKSGSRPPEDYVNSMFDDHYRSQVQAALQQCIDTGGSYILEGVFRDVSGQERHMRTLGEAIRDQSGTVVRVQGAFCDITEQVEEREARRELEERLSATLDQIADGICFIDRQWHFTFVNKACEIYLQNPASILLGNSLWDLYPDAKGSDFEVAYLKAMEDGEVGSVRAYFEPLQCWFEVTVYPTDEGIAVYLRDVSADEATRQQLAHNTAKLQEQASLLDVARDAILVRSLDHEIRYWNRAAEKLYGWSVSEVLGSSIRELIYDEPTEFDEATAEVVANGFWVGVLSQRTRDGRSIIVDCRWQLMRDAGGEPVSIFAVNSDITEIRREEEQRIRSQRMESLGTLAGGIAHDLNNVLTPILMSVQLLDQSEQDEGKRELLRTMETGIKRGADMIRQVLSFAKGTPGEVQAVRIEDLVHEVMGLAHDLLPKSISIRTELEPDLWPVMGDPTQLMQVLVNLVTNARDAMGTTGTLTIRTSNLELSENYSSVTDLAMPGRYVSIELEDTGHGMDQQTAAKIFEPFYTTKEIGHGTGLGLATSLAIVRSHGGFIHLYSEPDHGTRFQVHLPATEATHSAVIPPEQMPLPRGSGERILVIDDEAAIRHIVRQTLDTHGYRTEVAANGREGINAIEKAKEPFDLVLTDMMMPVMDGAATATYLAEHHPELIVIAASGLNANGGVARAAHAGIRHFIPKPFTTDSLLTTISLAFYERRAGE